MLPGALVIIFCGGGRCFSFPCSRDRILGVDWVRGGGHRGGDPISKRVGEAIDIGFVAASGSWSGYYWCRGWTICFNFNIIGRLVQRGIGWGLVGRLIRRGITLTWALGRQCAYQKFCQDVL